MSARAGIVAHPRARHFGGVLGLSVLGVSALGLSACTVGPNYKAPVIETPAHFAEGPHPDSRPDPHPGPDQGAPRGVVIEAATDTAAWWERFGDPVLNDLVRRSLAANLDLQEAGSRIRQARAQEVVAGAAGLPQVNATGNTLRLNRSASAQSPLAGLTGSGASGSAGSGGSTASASPSHIDYFTAGFDATWEIDLFGGVRRGVEQARATTQAQVWRQRDTQVSVTAEVANDYLQYRLAQARLVVLKADLDRQNGVLKIVGDRFRTGLVTNLDVNQQRSQQASTQSQIPQVEAQAAGQLHALGVLLGETPEAMADALRATPAGAPASTPPQLPVGLPSELLQRRPDIRAAERQLAAANAQIGVQTAALYPSVNLLAMGSFGSADIATLFRGSNAISAGLGMAQWSVLSGGRDRANVRIAREQYEQAQLEYRKTVLQALRDAEDSLARYAAEQRRWSALKGAYDAAQNSFIIAGQQYAVGLVNYTNVYEAQGALLSAQDQLTQSDAQIAQDVVSIYKALGGGWRDDVAPTLTSARPVAQPPPG